MRGCSVTNEPDKKTGFNAEQLLAEFRDLEGMFGEASLHEVLADRRYGIEGCGNLFASEEP